MAKGDADLPDSIGLWISSPYSYSSAFVFFTGYQKKSPYYSETFFAIDTIFAKLAFTIIKLQFLDFDFLFLLFRTNIVSLYIEEYENVA